MIATWLVHVTRCARGVQMQVSEAASGAARSGVAAAASVASLVVKHEEACRKCSTKGGETGALISTDES